MDKTVPLGRVKGTLTPPCSKSYAQRALAASLLCGETSVLRNLEFCDDTRSALRCIETLGARVKHVDASTLSIEGGLHPRGKVLHVGESGLATRLFTPIASLCGMPVTTAKIAGRGFLAPGFLRAFQKGAVGRTDVKTGRESLQTVHQMPFPGAGIFGHHAQSAHIAGFVIRSAHNNQAAPRSFAHGIQPRLLHHAVHHFNGGLKPLPSASAS